MVSRVTLQRIARLLPGAALLFAVALLTPVMVLARTDSASAAVESSIHLRVAAGYQNIYRGTAWTPIRVTVSNSGDADISGSLQIPQPGQSAAVGAQPDFHGLYQAPVVVPAGDTRTVTVYVPGTSVQGEVSVRFLQGNKTLATASALPVGIDTSALLIGVLGSTPADTQWVGPAIQQQVTTHVIQLSSATIDPVPQALATFDLIVFTNADTSQLDRSQLDALDSYVHNGGSLLVVGGPTWQETLHPLPATLLPGHLTGLRVLPSLRGLIPLALTPHPLGTIPSAVSVLSQPRGTVLASQAGIPLVVRAEEGQGTVEYLAFDPALSTIQQWSGASGLLTHLVSMAAPGAITRTWEPGGFRARFQTVFRSEALTNELSNLPPSTVPFLALFAALTLAYVLVLGPANFVILRFLHRQNLAWVTIPVLSVTYLGSVIGISTHLRASSAVLNTVGLVALDGGTSSSPATMYVGLATPQSGDYQLTYDGASLAAPIPQLRNTDGFSFRSASTLQATPLGMRLQEDPQTTVSFVSMRRWTMRDLSIQTSVPIHGTVQSGLTIDSHGDLVGRIYNTTGLDVLDPVVVAGQAVARIATIPAGGSTYVRIQPSTDNFNGGGQSVWNQLYGGSNSDPADNFRHFGGCCDQFSYPTESQTIDRIRNAVSMLSQAQPDALSAVGEVALIGWSERPLATMHVDGTAPQRRDLTALVAPLGVRFPARGSFRLLAGTLGSHLVDVLPRAPQSTCCGFGPGNDQGQEASVAPGGFLTFEFDLPATVRVRFRQIAINVNSGDDGANVGDAYDWHANRWVKIDLSSGDARLSNPDRFVSPAGQLMVRLLATNQGGDLNVYDPNTDIQISGTGATT